MNGPSLKERVRMALAEAGYPNAEVNGTDTDPSVVLTGDRGVPGEVCWRAFKVADFPCTPCWDCWQMGEADPDHFDCQCQCDGSCDA